MEQSLRSNVLIVDDELGSRESLKMILKPCFNVYTAENGRCALETVKKIPIDLVTLDLKMPGMPGEEVLRHIKDLDPSIEVIIITGYGTLQSAVEAIRYKVFDYIVKPFNVADILSTVKRCTEKRELRSRIKDVLLEVEKEPKSSLKIYEQITHFLNQLDEFYYPLKGQEHEIERIGSTKRMKVDVRVIAAINKDLKGAIKEGDFREDLFYRLNVIPIGVPPLRERKDDVFLLAQHFLEETTKRVKKRVKGLSKSAKQALIQYSWPGNVRELKNRIERAVILCSKNVISQKDLGLNMEKPKSLLTLKEAKSRLEKEYINEALEITQGNITKAARMIDVNRMVFSRLVKKYEINRESFKIQNFI